MTMEAQISRGALWKRIIDSMKDLVSEANFDCSGSGISIQAMDQAHVALVSLGLQGAGFALYECHRQQVLGVNLANLAKILKITENDDLLTLRHEPDSDVMTIAADPPKDSNLKKRAEFQLKLMEIDSEAMGIPDLEYKAQVSMPSDVFARIVRDMSVFGETITMDVSREAVQFSGAGDLGEGFIRIESDGAYEARLKPESVVKQEGGIKTEVKLEGGVKKEPVDDEDQRISDKYPIVNDNKKKGKPEGRDKTYITVEEPLQLSFALKYLNNFAKGSAISDRVEISLARDCPCRIEYGIEELGFLRWFLAPKVDEE